MSYPITLTIHLLAVLAAAATSAIVHFAAARQASAPTLRQSLEWGKLAGSAARIFPVSVAILVATGAWMVHAQWSWSTPWVVTGITGAILLLASGATLGKRGAAGARASVERLQRAGHDLPNDSGHDVLAAAVGHANTGFAIAIVVVMTAKPGVAGSVALLLIGAALGAWQGVAHARPKPHPVGMAEAA